jgi:hypothetical protein
MHQGADTPCRYITCSHIALGANTHTSSQQTPAQQHIMHLQARIPKLLGANSSVQHTLQRLLQHLVDLSNLLQLSAVVRQHCGVGCAELHVYCWLPYVLHQK